MGKLQVPTKVTVGTVIADRPPPASQILRQQTRRKDSDGLCSGCEPFRMARVHTLIAARKCEFDEGQGTKPDLGLNHF